MASKDEIRNDLIAWANGDLTKRRPSEFGGPGTAANELLWDAVLFEEGRYKCDDQEQQEKAIDAIEAFCDSDAVQEFENA